MKRNVSNRHWTCPIIQHQKLMLKMPLLYYVVITDDAKNSLSKTVMLYLFIASVYVVFNTFAKKTVML